LKKNGAQHTTTEFVAVARQMLQRLPAETVRRRRAVRRRAAGAGFPRIPISYEFPLDPEKEQS
jgi:hypothetical protein